MTSSKKSTPYQQLIALSKKLHLLKSVEHILEWDQETYMPKGAAELRAETSETLAGLIHAEETGPAYTQALEKVINLQTGDFIDASLSDRQRVCAWEMRRDYLKQAKLSKEFVEKFAAVTSAAHHAWVDARAHNDFGIFRPHLEKIIDLNRKKADLLGYEHHRYDALLDCFEPGTSTDTLSPLFERLSGKLALLFKRIQAKPKPQSPFFACHYDRDTQFAMGKTLLAAMGFSAEYSRLDKSIHPMCVPLHPHDVRMTTRIDSNSIVTNILSCIHEGGHGLYHSNLPIEELGTPLSQASSFGVDESQSRTWETLIGRSLPFWQFFFPKLQQAFPKQLGEVSLNAFYQGLNTVAPSPIRVDSDEVSYNLHILLRFELEKALMEGTLQAKEIPQAWNEKMTTYLGITPKSDVEGCLQDIHWAMGAFGYFPTYTLGNLYAAQFFEAFEKEHPSWDASIRRGDMSELADWQKNQIHIHGRLYLPHKLCQRITGRPLSEQPFIDYLTKKYSAIYDL